MYRITVGVDVAAAAPASSAAIEWVIAWHRASTARITLVTAFDLLIDEVDEEAAALARAADRIRAAVPGAVVETAMADGSVPGVLERSSRVADLLVVGSHRSRHLRAVLTGRLPLRVAEHAACPVVVVPDDWHHRSGAILAGLADHESSFGAIDFAAAEAADLDRELRILHAWSFPTAAAGVATPGNDHEAVRGEHAQYLAATAQRARQRCRSVREYLHEGAAGGGLVALAADAALTVVGTHRTGPIGEILLGNTAATLIRESRTPVCVVPAGWA